MTFQYAYVLEIAYDCSSFISIVASKYQYLSIQNCHNSIAFATKTSIKCTFSMANAVSIRDV